MKNALSVGFCALLLACSRTPEEPPKSSAPRPSEAARSCPSDPDPQPKLPVVQLKARGGAVVIDAEFAYSPEDTARGLMYRTEMGAREGMLFKLPFQLQSFWMRNTCLSLDMLFLADDGTILGVLPHVPPLNDRPRGIDQPSRYVLELNAGAAADLGLKAGEIIELPSAVLSQALARE